jgi:hypothetical protein
MQAWVEAASCREEDEVDGLAVVVAANRKEEVVVEVGRKEAAQVAGVLAAEEAHEVGVLEAVEVLTVATNEQSTQLARTVKLSCISTR